MTRNETRADTGPDLEPPASARPAGSGSRGPRSDPAGNQTRGQALSQLNTAVSEGETDTPTVSGPCPTCGRGSPLPTPVCRCGHTWTMHNIETKRAACSLFTCGCRQFQESKR